MGRYRQQFLARLAEQERTLAREYDALADQVLAAVVQAIDTRTNRVPPEREAALYQRIAAIILAFYLVPPAMTALRTGADGRAQPVSPYMRILWATMRASAEIAAEQQAAYLRRQWQNDPDLIGRMERARLSFVSNEAMNAVSERGAEFLSDFAPPYLYPRADGKVLEERVRYAAIDHSTKTTGLIRELLAEGATIAVIAALLRRFFTPDATLPRGGLYGTTGVNRAMAIARSEPVFAHGVTQRVAALFNPFVESAVVSRSRPEACPICDPMVGVYPADDYPVPGFHPHCVCKVEFITTRDARAARNRVIGTGAVNVRGPLSPGFVDEVMG